MMRQNLALVLLAFSLVSVHAQPQARCRKPGTAYDLDTANLPLCRAMPSYNPRPTGRAPASSAPSAFTAQQAQKRGQQVPARQPAQNRQPAASMSFDSYMRANASNSAIRGRHPLPQEAFKDYSKPAVISGSTLDTPQPAPANNGGFTLPAGVTLPPGMTLPAGVTLPSGFGAGGAVSAQPSTDTPITLPATDTNSATGTSAPAPNR